MASSQASQDDSVSKFAHLLQPIRDLASNWDVNIADELEDYLVRVYTSRTPPPPRRYLSASCHGQNTSLQEVLESVKFSFEDGPSLNFAEGDSLPLASPTARSCRVQLPQSDWVTVGTHAAALVIQGSACVYSKKVEYLHKLVYEALECIEKKRCSHCRNEMCQRHDSPALLPDAPAQCDS